MAVVENADSSNRADSLVHNSVDHSKSVSNGDPTFWSNDQTSFVKKPPHRTNGDGAEEMSLVKQQGHSVNGNGGTHQMMMRDLEEMLSKLNPMAEEFVPPSLVVNYKPFLQQIVPGAAHFGYVPADNSFIMQLNSPVANGNSTRRVSCYYCDCYCYPLSLAFMNVFEFCLVFAICLYYVSRGLKLECS